MNSALMLQQRITVPDITTHSQVQKFHNIHFKLTKYTFKQTLCLWFLVIFYPYMLNFAVVMHGCLLYRTAYSSIKPVPFKKNKSPIYIVTIIQAQINVIIRGKKLSLLQSHQETLWPFNHIEDPVFTRILDNDV